MSKLRMIFSIVVILVAIGMLSSVVSAASNANKTGEKKTFNSQKNSIYRNRIGQFTHGEYQNNTNSCASCHMTHTASSSTLLFKDNKNDTCVVCHDGTMLKAIDLYGYSMNAGTFNKGMSYSQHNLFSSAKLSSSPGGNKTGSGNWGETLGCGSCHNPHGTDSMCMLNTSSVGDSNVKQASTRVYDSIPSRKTTNYILVYRTVDRNNLPWKAGYYKSLITSGKVANGSKVLMTYWWDNTDKKYVADYPLWDTSASGFDAKLRNTSFTVDAKHGMAYGSGLTSRVPTGTTLKNLSFGISVQPYRNSDGKIANRSYFDDTYANYNAGAGRQLSLFCGQCHTDYVSNGHVFKTGKYSTAFRHKTDDDANSCTRCHFAHGTDVMMMRDAAGKSVNELVSSKTMTKTQAQSYMKDINFSSALKRYTGMSVCFSCHGDDPRISNDLTSMKNYGEQNGFKAGVGLGNKPF